MTSIERDSRFGMLCLIGGIVGVIMTLKSALLSPQSLLLFILGMVTSCTSLLMRILQMIYSHKR
jgi:hypothetical protein